MQTGTTKTRHCWALALMLLLQACASPMPSAPLAQPSPEPMVSIPPPPLTSKYCVGRLNLTTQETLHISRNKAHFYWGDIATFRETTAQYADRLNDALALSKVNPLRKRVLPPAHFMPNDGMLLLLHEEESPPLDPHVVKIEAFAHRDGTTFQYKKTALSRLKKIAQLRAREILQSVSSMQQPFTRDTQVPGFCLMHGSVMLAPLPGWFESNEIQGDFKVMGHSYGFSLRMHVLKSDAHNASALENQRDLMAELLGATDSFTPGPPLSSAEGTGNSGIDGRSSIFEVNTQEGKNLLYEWHSPALSGDIFAPAIFLYIWPLADVTDGNADATFMQWIQGRKGLSPPLFQMTANAATSDGLQHKAAPAKEESKVVYRPRLAYEEDQYAARQHYLIYKEDKKVAEGRSDKQGFPEAQNADYQERWHIQVMSD